jgi:epoxide hydrolase-like predicted phosphatase
MTIRAVIFDIGGVLFRLQDVSQRRRWEMRLGLSEGQLVETVFNNPVARRATVGDATTEEVWVEAGNRLGLQPEELEVLKVDIWKGGEWDTELLAFIRSLKTRYKTGTISDAWPDARESTKEYINNDIFDVSVFSAEEGLQKPNSGIYQRALSRLRVASQEAVFVDDMPQNVEGARLVGMHAVLFTDPVKAREEIRQLLQTS